MGHGFHSYVSLPEGSLIHLPQIQPLVQLVHQLRQAFGSHCWIVLLIHLGISNPWGYPQIIHFNYKPSGCWGTAHFRKKNAYIYIYIAFMLVVLC